jgi:pyruvate formate lyase activating enzyme
LQQAADQAIAAARAGEYHWGLSTRRGSTVGPGSTSPSRWAPADFYHADGAALRCTLCPHACALADGETGACRVRRRAGGRLETATFATAVRHLDAVERKPLYHYRPGSRALTLAAPGCSFTCHYCANYRLSQYGRLPEAAWGAEPVDAEAVVAEAAGHGAAVALSYSEPTLAAELTLALAAAGRPRGVALLWKTNGFITPAALERLAPCLAAVNVDLKAADDDRHRALTGAPLAPVLEALAGFARAGVWVEVSTPVIPRVNADRAALRAIAEAVARVGRHVPWHLLRFTPDFRMRRLPPTQPDELREAARLGREAGLHFVYVERALGPPGCTTYCPGCGAEVVTRDVWEAREVRLVGGACPGCGYRVPGRW